MADITPIRADDALYALPGFADDEQGANGFEWRMAWWLRDLAGTEACLAMQADDSRATRWHQWREQFFDRIASRIEQELPEPVFGESASPSISLPEDSTDA